MRKRAMTVGVWLLTAALGWGAANALQRPAAFPRVALSPGSLPYFASVMVDVDTNQIAYLCFDGNVSNGYERLYFWIPDDSTYRTPKPFRLNSETKRFGPVTFKPKHDKDELKIDWSFSWAPSGGSYQQFDYLTGKTRKIARGIYPRFFFRVDYLRQPRGGPRPSPTLVDITIPGEISVSGWTNMAAALQPWHTLNYYMTTKLVRDKDHTLVHFAGILNYANNPITVRAMPRETVCTLVVSPYLEQPIYSNDMTWAEAIGTGVDVKLEYRWYDLDWNITSPGLRIYPNRGVAVRSSPFPITRFDD